MVLDRNKPPCHPNQRMNDPKPKLLLLKTKKKTTTTTKHIIEECSILIIPLS